MMTEQNRDLLEQVHFDDYLLLLMTLCPAIEGLLVFDHQGDQIWQQDSTPPGSQQVATLVSELLDSAEISQTGHLPDGAVIELVKLGDPQGASLLVLGLLYAQAVPFETATIAGQSEFIRLSALLLADYSQAIELGRRAGEIRQISDQLNQREQELGLIYKAEDEATNTHNGRELLRQLVQNTSRFLNVDVSYLYIVNQNIAMHRYRNNNVVSHAELLFDCLRDAVYPQLLKNPQPLLVNGREGIDKLGCAPELPFKFVACAIVNSEGETTGMLATAIEDLSADDFSVSDSNLLEIMAKKASRIAQAHFDPLTGLENSHSFELILRDLLRESHDRGVQHAIANIDVDRLAVVNDISGRAAGNHLIKMIAHKLVDLVRSGDLVARLGSDKFGILLKDCDLETASAIMKKLSHAISSLDVEWEGKRHEASISIGVAPITDQALSVTGLLEAAETARNVSKQRGRNNIHVLDVEDRNLLRRKEQIRWVGRIQEAMRDNRFRLYAQPIEAIGAQSDRKHYEILIRLQEKDGKIVDPGAFLAAAESFYLMASLDLWVINQALYELTLMQQIGGNENCQLSINLSGQSLNDPYTLATYIENKLEEYELDGEDICFEITESAAIANLDEAGLFIEHIRELGCKFSLDDFGTGLSSFSYLKKLNVDYLKIDGSFVRDILRDPVSESMVAAINQVGQAMDLETVAEYVEDDEIREKLVSLGVDYGQGYGIARPALFSQIQQDLAKSA